MSKQKRGVQYMKQDEPAFLKKMKLQAGFKEGPNVDTKREQLDNVDSDSDNEKDDEKPQVVVLAAGDLTEVQAKQAELETATKPREATDEKITFKKPSKLKTDTDDKKKQNKLEKKKSSAKKVKNSSLLSFNEEDEEDE